MATEIENPGGVVVEVPDDRAGQLLEQDGFTRPDQEATSEAQAEGLELPEEGPVAVSNPGGAVVDVPRERAPDVLAQDGFELTEPELESPPAPPAPTPEPDESEGGESESSDESDQSDEAAPETDEGGGPDDEADVEELSVEQMLDRPEQEAAELALAGDDYNTMRSVLAGLVDESTQGMGKSEVREALEQIGQ